MIRLVGRPWCNIHVFSTILAVLLLSAPASQAQDSQAEPTSAQKTFRLIASGRNVDAVEQAKIYAQSAPLKDRQEAFGNAAWACIVTYDIECALDVLSMSDRLIKDLPGADVERSTYGDSLLLWSFLQTVTGDNNAVQKAVGSAFPDGVTTALADPILFASLHIFSARRAVSAGDFEASREHLDKALASTLSVQYERFDAPRLIVQIAGLLIESYDVERALRLLATAEPILLGIPENSLLFCEYLQVRAGLFGILKNIEASAKDLRLALDKLDQLQAKPELIAYMRAGIYNDLLGTEGGCPALC